MSRNNEGLTPIDGGATPARAPLIKSPLIILGAPRSGTTMLFEALSQHPDLWSLYRESQRIIEDFFPVTMVPGHSDRVLATDFTPAVADAMMHKFYDQVGNLDASQSLTSKFLTVSPFWRMRSIAVHIPFVSRIRLGALRTRVGKGQKQPPIRIVEKTPENCLRVPLLRSVFPDARFIYMTRNPNASIASIMEGWLNDTQFRTHEFPPGFRLEGYVGRHWCFGLLPQWEDLNGLPVSAVCAKQWVEYNSYCRTGLADVEGQVFQLRYEDLVSKPGGTLRAVADWADLDYGPLEQFAAGFPTTNTRSLPKSDKWQKFGSDLNQVRAIVEPEATLAGYDIP